jgi:DNA (cytosine-5)-methyltransferase 1
MGRVIWQTRPKVVLLENVSKAAILEAKKDLGVLGYETVVRKVSAKDCGAPHLRNRWWVCAHTYNKGKFQRAINAEVAKLPKLCKGVWSRSAYCKAVQFSDGFPRKLDGLKQFGNSVIPQIPEAFGRAIMEQEL